MFVRKSKYDNLLNYYHVVLDLLHRCNEEIELLKNKKEDNLKELLKDYPIAILSKNHNVKVYENGIESKNITYVVFHHSADNAPTLEMKKVG